MADVYIVVFTVIGILLSVPALIITVSLLMPHVTKRAQLRLSQSFGKSFALGIPIAGAFLLWIAITSQVSVGPVQAMAFIAAVIGMGLATIGAGGMARLLGERIGNSSSPHSEMHNLVRGSIVYLLACLTPIVGWFLFVPIVGIAIVGAASFGLLNWMPKEEIAVAIECVEGEPIDDTQSLNRPIA